MEFVDSNIGNLQPLIENYEYLIRDLTFEIQTFQVEYSDLNSKIKNVVIENDKLSQEITQLIQKEQSDVSSQDPQIIDNLKKQLNLIGSEKDYAMKLWRNALGTIDHLEDELRIHREGKNDYFSKEDFLKLKKECNNRIKELEEELKLTRTALIKQKTMNTNKTDAEFLNKQESTTKIIQNLEEEILTLQQRLKQSNKTKDELMKTVHKQFKKIQSLENKNSEYVGKVSEAVQVVEAACMEKDFALMREKETKDEMTKVSKSLLEVIEQAENKLKTEVENVKTDFNSNLKNILEDLKVAHSDSLAKQAEIDTYAKQCALLEREIERLQRRSSEFPQFEDSDKFSKLLILEKNLERTFQKLLTSEKENIILNAEITRLKSDMEDMIKHYESDVRTREIEKTSLRKKIEHMKNEVNDGNKKYHNVLGKMEEMKDRLFEMQQKFKEEIERREKEFQTYHIEEIDIIKEKNEGNMRVLEEQLLAQMELNQKWRSETKLMISKFEGQLKRQRDVLRKLQQVNWNLKRKLRGSKKRSRHKQDVTVLMEASQIETKLKLPKKVEGE